MICPQTKAECNLRTCGMLRWCAKTSRDPSPPPPTLADIERLVDAFRDSVQAAEFYRNPHYDIGEAEDRAALMAAIRAYGRE